jgi:broad specificity phosphatase PhoE
MAKLFFMRHTKTDMNKDGLWSGRTDCNITEEGKEMARISDAETEMYIQRKIQPPNGESYQEVERRVKSFVEELFNKHENENILIVSHATILRMVRDIFLPNMEKKPIKNSQVLIVTNNEFNAYKERNNNYDE